MVEQPTMETRSTPWRPTVAIVQTASDTSQESRKTSTSGRASRRICATLAATLVIALILTALLCAFGMACMPQWRVEPFTNHIAVRSSDTAIRAKGTATPQEGRYRVRETHITVRLSGKVKAAAIVREPIGAPKGHAACLFMHGSGTGKSSEAYGDIARAMATASITTLVPDKRLDNYSMLNRDYVSSANDYAKSLRILRHWTGVSAAKTGIYAESEGTWIATVLTREHPDLAFAVLTSSPVVSGRQQTAMAATSYLKSAGAPEAVIRIIPKLTSLSIGGIGPNYADFDASYYRRSLTMPLLINYGTQDTAMPIEQGARLLVQAANATGNHNVTLRYYDANHQMRTGRLSAPNLPLASHYTHDLEDWVNAVAAGTRAGDWKTPMIAGSQPHQEFTAPLSTNAGLVTSLGVLASAILLCLACCAAAAIGGIVLLIMHMVRAHRHTSGNYPSSPRFPTSLRIALMTNVALAAVTTCVFLAYLIMVVQDAIALTDSSAALARGWYGVVALCWLELIAFAWLIAQRVVVRMPRSPHARAEHIRPWLQAAASCQGGEETWGGGHTVVFACATLASALSLLLLAFWGLFS